MQQLAKAARHRYRRRRMSRGTSTVFVDIMAGPLSNRPNPTPRLAKQSVGRRMHDKQVPRVRRRSIHPRGRPLVRLASDRLASAGVASGLAIALEMSFRPSLAANVEQGRRRSRPRTDQQSRTLPPIRERQARPNARRQLHYPCCSPSRSLQPGGNRFVPGFDHLRSRTATRA